MKIIEFLGIPRAGKTTQIKLLSKFLQNRGKKVLVLTDRERARNLFTPPTEGLAYTLLFFSQVIESYFKNKDKVDYLLIDRGIFDVVVWSDVRLHFKEITRKECESLKVIFKRFRNLIDATIYFKSFHETSIQRHTYTKHEVVDDVAMNKKWLYALSVAYKKNRKLFINCLSLDGSKSIDVLRKQIEKFILKV